ncbi:hypothetical protein [Denitromonas halophila]|uniref:Uncharacterized protein n=1 Tax=Denitromonas halophila TaxID=1629404 RepID=A0A557QGC5_9RHOO|nr:hypothetical protein [Denitromonas halophila]TVO51965.1 hypothetical protein FHP91_18900 [Denitromonas halophila]
MKRSLCALLLGCASLGTAQAQHTHAAPLAPEAAPTPWSRAPLLLAARGGGRGAASIVVQNISSQAVTVFAPGGDPARLKLDYPAAAGRTAIQPSGATMGNYHWVQAREERDTTVRVASTVWYFNNPGDAPTQLLTQPKSELEIVPTPLPREHGHYRESERWRFLVRWQGKPLADHPVTMETEFGSRSTLFTNAHGVATIIFPRDFDPEKAQAAHDRPKAGFVLSTTHHAANRQFMTAFNHTYSPEPERSRSLAWGAAFSTLGALIAFPLLRRKEATHG